jgi:hypothetical protein
VTVTVVVVGEVLVVLVVAVEAGGLGGDPWAGPTTANAKPPAARKAATTMTGKCRSFRVLLLSSAGLGTDPRRGGSSPPIYT